MADLIDRDYIREEMKKRINADNTSELVIELCKIIKDAPAVEERTRRHARWVIQCSNCFVDNDYKSNYCPYCGAEMDNGG